MELKYNIWQFALRTKEDLRSKATLPNIARNVPRFIRRLKNPNPLTLPPHELSHYENVLARIQSDPNCVIVRLPDVSTGHGIVQDKINVVIRHDIDSGYSDIAEALCRIDKKFSIKSSIHILVDGTIYDPSSLAGFVNIFNNLEFDVGLHSQAWLQNNFSEAFREELRMFKSNFGFMPVTFSHHGAWPRSNESLRRRRSITRNISKLIHDTSIRGHFDTYNWLSHDSNVRGRPVPLNGDFFATGQKGFFGGVSLLLTHDTHWKL